MTNKKNSYDAMVAATYDSDRMLEPHWEDENRFVQEYFQSQRTGSIVDVPVGTGRYFPIYPESAEIIGVDISADMIEQAKKKILPKDFARYSFHIADAKSLDFIDDHSIDYLVCTRLLHLVDNNERLAILKEFSRILKGEVILQVYLSRPPRHIVIRGLSWVKRMFTIIRNRNNSESNSKPWSHIKSYPLQEKDLLRMIKDSKLVVSKMVHLSFYYENDVRMYVLRKE